MTDKKGSEIIFIGNARDFHAMDWYRAIKNICSDNEVYFATDLIHSEGHRIIVDEGDRILSLFNIDGFLLAKQSKFGNIWRNLVKLVFFPVQVKRLKRIVKRFPDAVYHAHTMYYLFIAWRARIRYIGSPQGDEILIRPFRSRLYKFFATKSLEASEHLIVDSVNLQNGIRKLCGREADVIQYGIDVAAIRQHAMPVSAHTKVASIRAWYELYRIHEILKARNEMLPEQQLTLFYPFWEDNYKKKIIDLLHPFDENIGRMTTKAEVYDVLACTMLAISIPESDSSPRSVYESVFSGCCVAVTYNPWIESVPECIRRRIVVVNLSNAGWLIDAIDAAKTIASTPYIPSEAALEMFDQERSMRKVARTYYGYSG
jgi:hypothetical protein